MRVYNTYYKPSNMLIYVSGRQDISKTLRMLDGYLSQADKSAAPEITFNHTPVSPAQTVQEYNITDATKTVDIGFMAAGPDATDLKKSEAWGVLVGYLQQRMQEKFTDAEIEIYITGGMSGGVYNMGLILSGIPVAEKDEAIEIFRFHLDETAKNGIPSDELNKHLDSQLKAQQFGREEIFTGFAYAGDPFACVGREAIINAMRGDAGTFKNLAAEWQNTPYQTIVVSGNGAVKTFAVPEPQLTDAELKQVKKDTEAFNKWVDTPDSEQALATLPQLSTEELIGNTFDKPQYSETTAEAVWYRTVDDEAVEPSFSLYFPIEAETEDLSSWCLLCEFLTSRLEETGLSEYFGISACASSTDPETLAPRFIVSGTTEPGKTGENVRDVLSFLKNSPLEDSQALRAFLEDRKRELKVKYIDPYPTEYDYHLRSLGQEQRFLTAAPTGFVNSSISYKAFIDAAADDPTGDTALLERLHGLLEKALHRGNIIAGFTGSENDYSSFRTSAAAFLAELPEGNGKTSCEFLPAGWPSALIVSSGSMDSNHVMMSAQLHGEKDTATLKILGSVLSAKYLLPALRDKYGAYGANCRFDESDMSFSCSGGVSVDDVLAVYQNTGNWLRGLSLTEQELNGYRIGALKEYDELAGWERGDAAALAMSGKTQKDFDREREAILSVTLDDLKGCADFVDSLAVQGHVFAQVTKTSEGSVRFPSAVRVDADSGKETVLLKDSTPVSDDATPLTRGETASLLADSLLAAGEVEQASESRFADVEPGSEQAEAIALMHDRNILHGYGDGTFRPGQPVSRAEFCSIASVLLRDVTADASPEFTDVPSTHWAHEVITNMAAQGILIGDGNGHFYPDRTVTRQEAETILNRLSAEQS